MPRRPITVALSLIALVVIVAVAGYGLYLANMAGRLPWQEEPTRIPVTPFANLPGSGTDDDDNDGAGTPVSDTSSWRIGTLAFVPADAA